MAIAHDRINCWIFDLDNTLYPASSDLFALIDVRMTDYIARLLDVDHGKARGIQKRYFIDHGTTLAGLMAVHGVDPHEFLHDVHAIELDRLTPDRALAQHLTALPGRKLVYTNGDHDYAVRVLAALGLDSIFDTVHDIHASAYQPKPDPRPYRALCDAQRIDPLRALMVEDMARNLVPAKALGMATVWVNNGSEHGDAGACTSFIDHEITAVTPWLAELLGATTP